MNIFEFIKNKKILWILAIPIFLIIVFLIFLASFLLRTPSNTTNLTGPTTETVDSIYSPGSFEREIERLSQKKKLSANDVIAKNYLMNSLGSQSGVLKETKNYKMEYVRSVDDLEVEILTLNIDSAKKEALSWISNIPGSGGLGLSPAGICNFPVIFYLNFDVKNSLAQDAVFDPNPPGCN